MLCFFFTQKLLGQPSLGFSMLIFGASLVAQWYKNPPANTGDMGSIPGLERFLREGNGNPLQNSCLGNPMNRGAWWATVHVVAKSQTGLRDCSEQRTGEHSMLMFRKVEYLLPRISHYNFSVWLPNIIFPFLYSCLSAYVIALIYSDA